MIPGSTSYDSFYDDAGLPKLKFAFLPKKCALSGKTIWLTFGYRYVHKRKVRHDTDIYYDEVHRWHDQIEHFIWELKK